MDAVVEHESRKADGSWAAAVRTVALLVVVGTLVAVWHPVAHEAAQAAAPDTKAAPADRAAAAPDMSVYFPARFPAPETADDGPQPPTF